MLKGLVPAPSFPAAPPPAAGARPRATLLCGLRCSAISAIRFFSAISAVLCALRFVLGPRHVHAVISPFTSIFTSVSCDGIADTVSMRAFFRLAGIQTVGGWAATAPTMTPARSMSARQVVFASIAAGARATAEQPIFSIGANPFDPL
jgi:hypothetical protein